MAAKGGSWKSGKFTPAGGGGGSSATESGNATSSNNDVNPESLITESALGGSRINPDAIAQAAAAIDQGTEASRFFADTDSMAERFRDRGQAVAAASEIAARLNHARSPGIIPGENLGNAVRHRNGPRITSQSQFNRVVDSVRSDLSAAGHRSDNMNLGSIRRAMGDRISRSEFDRRIISLANSRNLSMTGNPPSVGIGLNPNSTGWTLNSIDGVRVQGLSGGAGGVRRAINFDG